LPLLGIAYAVRPPSIHAVHDAPIEQEAMLRLLVQNMKKESHIEMLESKFAKAFENAGDAQIVVRGP
jgi:hypothetical protein